jgi:cell division inhibitor SepF
MGMMNKFFNLIGLQSDDDEDEFDKNRYGNSMEEYNSQPTETKSKNKANVVSIHSQKTVKLILSEPRSYEETQEIADHLRHKRLVIINLHKLKPEMALRLVDFLTGTVYALNGTISRIGANIFVCTPDTVDMSGTISEMTESESWS